MAGIAKCTQCGSETYVMPLHDERGGPPFCPICAGAWHAEHAPRRRAERVVIKALKAYKATGGSLYGKEFDQLQLTASGLASAFGYQSDSSDPDFSDLTSELLTATVALTHPDKHPIERKDEANRVTQELLALKPFVFPAPPPKQPPPPPKPAAKEKENDVSLNQRVSDLLKRQYPCEDCRNAIPLHYCNSCRAQWEKEQEQEHEREEEKRKEKNARQREQYKERKKWFTNTFPPQRIRCAACKKKFKPKRSDKRYCSAACRQRAYAKRDGKIQRPIDRQQIERTIREIFIANPDSAFSANDLCERVYSADWNQTERKYHNAVVAAAKKVSEQLGEHRSWFCAEWRGAPFVFFNHASVTSYAMARLRADAWNRRASEEELKSKLLDHEMYREFVSEGGAWWEHCQEYIAKFEAAQ
jgi:hypothetical protein